MSVTTTEAPSQREHITEAPSLQPAHSTEVAPRRAEIRPLSSASNPSIIPTVAELTTELQRQSQAWTTAVRVLEQAGHALDCAQMDRQFALADAQRVAPMVQQTAEQLTAAVEASRPGHPLTNLKELFAQNAKVLDELESVSTRLSATFIRYRSAWDEYQRAVLDAQRLGGHNPRTPSRM